MQKETPPLVRVEPEDTTAMCPRCGNTHLILVRTLFYKHCPDCNTEIVWKLEKGQPPLR